MKILITGSDGFLGQKLMSSLSGEYETYGTSRRISQQYQNRFPLEILDERNVSDLIGFLQPNVLIHTAALVNVEECEKERERAYRLHVEVTRNLSQICKKAHIKMIYFSTDYVFSGKEDGYSKESDKDPLNYYGKTKSIGEEVIKKRLEDYVIIRPTWLYGFNSFNDKNNFMLKVLNGGKISLDNQRVKYPILIEDISAMVKDIINTNYRGIVHVSGNEAITKYNFALRIREVFNMPEDNIFKSEQMEPNRPINVRLLENWKRVHGLNEGIEWVKKQIEELKEKNNENENNQI